MLAVVLGGYGHEAHSFTQIDIVESFRECLLADEPLMQGSVDLKKVNGTNYLIAVGMTFNKQIKQPGDPKAKLDMMKVAEIKARAEMAKYLETEVFTETTLTRETETQTTRVSGEVSKQQRIRRELQDVTVERAQLLMRRSIVIGTWYSADQQFYYSAVALPVPTNEKNEE